MLKPWLNRIHLFNQHTALNLTAIYPGAFNISPLPLYLRFAPIVESRTPDHLLPDPWSVETRGNFIKSRGAVQLR